MHHSLALQSRPTAARLLRRKGSRIRKALLLVQNLSTDNTLRMTFLWYCLFTGHLAAPGNHARDLREGYLDLKPTEVVMTSWPSRLGVERGDNNPTSLKKLVTETSMKETILSLRGRRPPFEKARTLCGESRKDATSLMPFLST